MQPQHSIEDIWAAHWAIMDMCPTYGLNDIALTTSDYIETDAIKELAALRSWRDRAVPLLRALVADALRYGDDWPWCQYCIHSTPEGHAADCPVTAARALLAESETPDAR